MAEPLIFIIAVDGLKKFESLTEGWVNKGSAVMLLYSIEDHFTKDDTEFKFNTTDSILVRKSDWERWIQTCTNTMVVRLRQEDVTQICVVGGYHEDDAERVYAPSWVFYRLKSGEEVEIDELWDTESSEDVLPIATKIHLRPLDNELYHADIEGEISKHLANFQSLQKGSTIVVPLESLGGYEVDIFVEECEPENEVLLRGDVALELVAPIEDVVEWSRAAIPAVPAVPVEQEDFSQMFPVAPVASVVASTMQFHAVDTTQKKFVPFSGVGYTCR